MEEKKREKLCEGESEMNQNTLEVCSKEMLRKTLEILGDDEDGMSFDEKKKVVESMLKNDYGAAKKMIIAECSEYQVTELFWRTGNIVSPDGRIILRKISEADKEKFLELQYENALIPFMFREEKFQNDLWEEHLEQNALRCSIVYAETDEYIGYCGVKNLSDSMWELEIELLKKWTHQGIGYMAMREFLDTVVYNTDVSEFRIRVNPDNYASQGLMRKLGAVPNGVSELLLHDEEAIRRCEEENMGCIDDRLKEVAVEFGGRAKNTFKPCSGI